MRARPHRERPAATSSSLLAEALRIAGATVEAALGAKEALRLIEKGFRPGVVLTDLMMPERSGEELIDDLRSNPATRGVPFELETLYSTLASVCA